MPFAPLARCAVTGYARVRRSASEADVGGRDGMGGPCGKEWAHEYVRVPEKPERAHMQAQGDTESRDAVEGGEGMKSTKRFKAALAAVLVLALSPLFGGAAFAEGSSAATYSGNKTAVTDPSTIWDWSGLIKSDTSSVGRIWTDKTVSDGEISKNGVTISKENGADFLTALTALSSTSNLSDTATTPLDIVLVLDASGSMDDAMGGGDDTKRIAALKSAANSFIDEIAKQNATVKDAAKQHQVAIVKFAGNKTDKVGNDTYRDGGYSYNYSQVMKTLAPCTDETKDAFSSQVNAIKPAGATNAAAGLELAKGQTSGRSDAKKVVIFFTDGTPTTQSSFSPDVASSAVGNAKDMKDAGAAVYSIGIFEGADPAKYPSEQGVSNENKLMHAVSSNYPSATYSYEKTSWWPGEYKWSFGDRAKGSDGKDAAFYKSATNADELKRVFDDISKEISTGAGYPTETSEGFEHETGYITFDDQLGDYMQVTDLSKLVYNGTVYGCKSKTTDGNVDTYHFSGDVHSGLAAADLKDVVITVTRSNDVAVGDKVQVKVPASLIPLRNFAIDLAKDTMSVSNTTPISVLYSSGVKPAALDLLENPDDAMKAYMEKNTDATGKVSFYANKWTGKETGDVVATFEPAAGNSYYYFTQDTPIYTDEACTVPAKSVEKGSTYYYKHNYYAMDNGKPVAKTEHVSFPGDAAEKVEGSIAWDSTGACYFKSGTPRLTYINELHKVKTDNPTATADDVLNPKWSGIEQSSAQTLINAYLGNNGKLSVDVPGTLTVTKQLQLPDGYNAADFANESFEFAITMQDAAGKSFNAVVKNANGEQQGDKFVLAFGQDGQAKHSLKPGETLYVYGLSAGWDYKVSETHRDGFTAEAAGAEGQIAAGNTSAVTYKNTYAASGTLDGETYLKGEKVLTGRAWLETDEFTFILKDADTSVEAPMPPTDTLGETRVKVTQPYGTPADTKVHFQFQDISYTKPGTYTYEIWESEALSTLNPGVSASQALYQVVVTVTDKDHNGTLTVESKMTKLVGDDGVKYEKPQPIEDDTASFVNEYNRFEVKWTPSGTKTYTDATGENPLKPGMFHVIACTDNPDAPLPQGEGAMRIDHEWGGKMWYGALTAVEAGGGIAFPQATFTYGNLDPETLDATFEYKIVEVVKVGDTWRAVRDVLADKTFDPAGMVYDQTVWAAKVTIADVGGTLELSAKYYENDSEEPITGAMFSFDNSYKPDSAKLEGDTAIHGTKVLTGRDMAEGEAFGFKLSAADGATQKAIDDGSIIIPKGAEEAVVSGAKAGDETRFSFGEMTFKKPGTYSFAVQEDKYCGKDLDAAGTATGGIVFDRHVHKVTVTVTDDHTGKLVAAVSYDNGPAKFENKYEQNAQFSGITVQKTLNGRDMAADEFSFSIHGVKSDTVSAEDAEARLTDSDRSFTNAARADGVACDMAKMNGVAFTQADIGKTFAYEVREVVPADAKPGVSYDNSVHTLEITVGMSGDPDKHLTLTTKLDGKVVDSATVAFVNGYQATPTSYDTATAGLSKVLEGRDWIDSDEFTFELKALDGGPLPKDAAGNDVTSATVTKANAGSFGFGEIKFTSDMVKAEPDHKRTFVYEVREVVPADDHKLPGIQYDGNVATIKVTVSDDGSGTLKASAVAENVTFVNRYTAEIDYTAAGGLNVAKTLTGRDMAEGQFTIKVTPGDEASAYALGLSLEGAEIAMPAAADGAQAVKSALGEQHVVLRQSDVGKTYTYKVVEVVGEKVTGYTYDTTEYTVTVTVEDNPEKAALTVKTVVAGPKGDKTYVYGADPSAAGTGPAVVPFTNTYAASTDNPGGAAAQVTATKALTGRPLSAGEFIFAVKYATGGDDLRTAKNAADGTVTFDGLHYTTEMLEGLVQDGNASRTSDKGVISWTVSYLAYEKTDGLADQGITPQTQPIPFKVTVVDNGNGSLTATANLGDGLKFENTYSTGDPVQVGLSGVKTLQAAPGLDPASIEGKFTFTVTSDDAAAPMPERTTAKNTADGNVDFGSITFTLDDLNRALGVNGQTAAADADKAEADAAKAADQATPAKEADQAADAAKAVADADKAAADAGNASSQAAGNGDKPAADEGDKPAAGDEQGAGAVAASDAASGTVDTVAPGNQPADQPANPEPESGKPRSHVFTYKVTESGDVPGVTNDAAATKTVSFKVTDDGAGKLTVERQGDAASPAFSFANTYKVGPAHFSVTDQVAVTKTLTGRDMAAGEFAFELLEGEDVVATGVNAADGSVALSAVKYTQPGTHRYTLHEVGGGTVANGVTYDGATYTVVTTVKDNGDGTLSVAHALEDAREATFANAYQATPTTVVIGASKTLVGKNLEDGQFTFVLTATDGTELKAKNAADGKIAFPALTFDKPGTYEFALTELDDAQANVTYDKHAYKVTVTVVDDGLGHLNATVAGDADVLAFTNTYAEPPAPVQPTQPTQPGGKTFTPSGPIGKVLTQTGDDRLALVLPLAAVALAGAASIAALCIMRRRDKR
ncbi:VWA domain-containing protein [Senegalimassilia faecalis]|uniref:VWA domain-containing protein n=2 Tax=Senegalimassilia faecalis TaxID=2509433 RepID=A0A4Q2K195_9ACTN|nr:VWA domain-containing protein [Senegalimassilia faecalis]